MAILNFPSNPTVGDTYEENGVTYTWDGDKWIASTSGSGDIYVNVSGDSMTGDLTVPSLNGGPLAGFRNQLINGSGVIAQRGASLTAVNDGDYTVDRWNTGGGVVVSKLTGLGALCPGIDNGISITTTAGRNWIRQGVELGSTGFAGKFTGQWTLSVWATQAPNCVLSFADDASFANPVQVVANTALTPTGEPNRVNGTRTYTHYSHTFNISQTPDAANECLTVQLSFPLSSQTLFSGVQLEPGPVATPFEHRPIGTELALCQRYYLSWGLRASGTSTTEGVVYKSAGAKCLPYWVGFPTTMRTTPSIDLSSTVVSTAGGFGATSTTSITPSARNTGDRGIWLGSSATNPSYTGVLIYSGSFSADAEL